MHSFLLDSIFFYPSRIFLPIKWSPLCFHLLLKIFQGYFSGTAFSESLCTDP